MIFITYSSNIYWPIQVSSAFVENQSSPFLYEPQFENVTSSNPAINNTLFDREIIFDKEVGRLKTLLKQNSLERLETASCIDAYNVKYQTSYGSVLLVSANSSSTVHQECSRKCSFDCDGRRFQGGSVCSSVNDPTWMCANAERLRGSVSSCLTQAQELRSNATHWIPNGNVLDGTLSTSYCLAEKKEGLCILQTSPHMAIVVLALNLIKAITMLVVSRLHTRRSLVTIGDFIRSFLKTPDQYTKSMCLASFQDIRKVRKEWAMSPKSYAQTRVRCLAAGGKLQWTGGILLYVVPASTNVFER